VYLPEGAGGLERDSIALCHQVTRLDRGKLTKRLGALSEDFVKQIEEGLKAALDMK
jgi:mRNA-degrading endonuclease toxin of MazEF toxin-antitoxin module